VAELDGRHIPWIKANYLFRAVLLPPGKHTVRFRYRPESFRHGLALGGLAMAGLLAVGLLRPRRRANL